jgi:hypothetical protein
MQLEYKILVTMYKLAYADNIWWGRSIKTLHSSIGAPPSHCCYPPKIPNTSKGIPDKKIYSSNHKLKE